MYGKVCMDQVPMHIGGPPGTSDRPPVPEALRDGSEKRESCRTRLSLGQYWARSTASLPVRARAVPGPFVFDSTVLGLSL